MKVIDGDLIQLALRGEFDVIIHGCNCFCTMGAGIAKQIRDTFPQAYQVDLQTIKGDSSKLGTFSTSTHSLENGNFVVVNAYTQYNWSTSKSRVVDYDAVKEVFTKIKREYTGLRIAYPKIGCGLANGDWDVISTIINNALNGEDHTLVNFKV